jgi:hypothetical protein
VRNLRYARVATIALVAMLEGEIEMHASALFDSYGKYNEYWGML